MNGTNSLNIKKTAAELAKLDANVKYLHWMYNNDLMSFRTYESKLEATKRAITLLERSLKAR